MQTSAIQNQQQKPTEELVQQILDAHNAAQALADKSIKDAFEAVKAAQKVGGMLAEVRTWLGAEKFELWCGASFDEEVATKWVPRYVSCAQLSLNLDDIDPRSLRQGMMALELIPQAERQSVDHSDDGMKYEQRLVKRVNDLCSMVKDLPKEKYDVYRVQFKEIYNWMTRELYK